MRRIVKCGTSVVKRISPQAAFAHCMRPYGFCFWRKEFSIFDSRTPSGEASVSMEKFHVAVDHGVLFIPDKSESMPFRFQTERGSIT